MSNSKTIRFSSRAQSEYWSLLYYLLEELGLDVLEAYVDRVETLMDHLVEYPSLGRATQPMEGIRRFVIVPQSCAYYSFSVTEIFVIMFFDTRQHPDKLRI